MKAASLTGHLLARKGDARPALAPARDAIGHLVEAAPAVNQTTQMRPPERMAGIATIMRPSLAEVVPPSRAGGDGGPGGSETVRLSVRMGRDRHRKLRILAAQRGLSLQQAMIQAIDGLVATAAGQPDASHCACLRKAGPSSEQPKS